MTRYLRHVPTGDLYVWNEHLAARLDMMPHPGPLEPATPDLGGPEPDIDAMTRHELIAYAKARFGVALSPRDKKEALASQVAVLLHEGK